MEPHDVLEIEHGKFHSDAFSKKSKYTGCTKCHGKLIQNQN